MQKKRRSITPEQYQLQNVKDIINLEKRDRIAMNMSDRIASTITAFSGSMLYVVLHVIWFILWILINTGSIGVRPFDPFPFNLLTMTVSLEAIFLSAFVLISQNKQAIQADRRAKIDLQVNMIAERENTKLIAMVAEIQQHLKIHKREDAEIKALKQTTNITHLANAIDKAEENLEGKKPKGPASAADTSK
jgi:uncharacterized membrane protein